MVNAWYKTHPASETMSNQIESWIQTCDLLTESQHFNEQKNWKVPTFQPWYHYDAYLCLQQYFHIQHRITDPKNHTEVDKQQQSAQKMFDTWEEVCFRVFQRNLTPIPKGLWYYKAKYVQRNETEKWKLFFHDTPFQTWGYADKKMRELKKAHQNPHPWTSPLQLENTITTPRPNPNAPTSPQTNAAQETRNSNGTGDYPTPANHTARVNDCPTSTTNKLCVYYQNVRGLRDEEKLEFLTRFMDEKKIDAFILTETHLEGDFQKTLPRKQLFIHHGPENQPRQGAKGGVGVILSPALAKH
jgi:hypothetical protein